MPRSISTLLTVNRVLGWLLLLPAVALGIWQIVVPAALAVWTSLFQTRPFGDGGTGRFLGLEAYVEAELVGPVLLGLVVGLPAFVVAGLAGVAIGSLAAGASDGLRIAVRGVLGVLVVLYAPIGIGLALRVAGRGDFGISIPDHRDGAGHAADGDGARGAGRDGGRGR